MRHSILSSVTAVALASSAFATVETRLYADTYIVKEGSGASARFYSVLDIYAKGNHLADSIGCSVLGLNTFGVSFKTSQSTGAGDIFVQGGSAGNGWLPTDSSAKRWDSFVAAGNRSQGSNARITNRAGTLIDHGVAGNWTGASNFSQMSVAGSNFIDEGTASGWYSSKGGNAYSTAAASENPFARVSLYNSNWNGSYADLYRGNEVLNSKGVMQTGQTSAATAAANRIDPTSSDVQVLAEDTGLSTLGGASLNFHWMVGRFAIEVTGKSNTEIITMVAQFNMVGKNGSGTNNETGTTFTGALTTGTNPQYKVSNHFAFAVPGPGAGLLMAMAGLIGRRRRN